MAEEHNQAEFSDTTKAVAALLVTAAVVIAVWVQPFANWTDEAIHRVFAGEPCVTNWDGEQHCGQAAVQSCVVPLDGCDAVAEWAARETP